MAVMTDKHNGFAGQSRDIVKKCKEGQSQPSYHEDHPRKCQQEGCPKQGYAFQLDPSELFCSLHQMVYCKDLNDKRNNLQGTANTD
jgi:hypothetical protein